jgi:hypothetical protein
VKLNALLGPVARHHELDSLDAHPRGAAIELERGRAEAAGRLTKRDFVVGLPRGSDQLLGDAMKRVPRIDERRRQRLQLDSHGDPELRSQALHQGLERPGADADEQDRKEDEECERAAESEAVCGNQPGEPDRGEHHELHALQSI